MDGWRTVSLSLVSLAVAAYDIFASLGTGQSQLLALIGIKPEAQGGIIALLAIAFGVLRVVTTGPVGQKKPGS